MSVLLKSVGQTWHHCILPCLEISGLDVLAGLIDKVEVECKVVLAGNLPGKKLSGNEKMSKISLRIGPVHKGCSLRVKRGEVIRPFLVPPVYDTVPGEQHAVASV